MKTILVPTDFSEVSKNAAHYAMQLAITLRAEKIILYNSYHAVPPVITEPTAPVMPVMDLDLLTDISNNNMKDLKEELELAGNSGIHVESRNEYGVVTDDIEKVCAEVGADLIVMGITGSSKIEEFLIGSTALGVIKETKVPVITVPLESSFQPIKNVMLACDFKKVMETTPVVPIKSFLNDTGAALQIVNVYESEKEFSDVKTQQQEILREVLADFQPSFHFIKSENFISAVNDFVDENQIDIIITIPKKHGFFEGFFKERHTKKLAFHSHVPLMFVHIEDL